MRFFGQNVILNRLFFLSKGIRYCIIIPHSYMFCLDNLFAMFLYNVEDFENVLDLSPGGSWVS